MVVILTLLLDLDPAAVDDLTAASVVLVDDGGADYGRVQRRLFRDLSSNLGVSRLGRVSTRFVAGLDRGLGCDLGRLWRDLRGRESFGLGRGEEVASVRVEGALVPGLADELRDLSLVADPVPALEVVPKVIHAEGFDLLVTVRVTFGPLALDVSGTGTEDAVHSGRGHGVVILFPRKTNPAINEAMLSV